MDELVYTDDRDGMKLCRPCGRWFVNYTAVLQHLKTSAKHDYCERCDRNFVDYIAKDQHIANSSSHNVCHLRDCQRSYFNGGDFPSRTALLEHFRSEENHHYCFTCKLDFESDSVRFEHWSHTQTCEVCLACETSFASRTDIIQHYETTANHYVCRKCDFLSTTQKSLYLHLENSRVHNWCTQCGRDFDSRSTLVQHWRSSSKHFFCRVCERSYSNTNELVQHQKLHQPRSISCACPLNFACFSALVIHWEAGKCTTNRATLNKLLLSFPEHRRFTVAEHINHLNGTATQIRDSDNSDFDRYSGMWNCPIQGCSDEFHSSNVLDQHLRSPYHDANAFKCPNAACDARFSCLSALLQHVENAKSCVENINQGTGCLGRLWLFLLEKFGMLSE